MKYITPEAHHALRPVTHASHRQHHVTPVSSPLYVVTAISNPNRYYSRYRLYQAFEKMCEDAGAILYTVELATRDRHFEVTTHENPRHIQLRAPDILWHKENLLNIGISRLPADWEYVAWIDADVQFARPDWAVEAVHQLQVYKVIQMWSHSIDLGPDYQTIAHCSSLYHTYSKNVNLLKPLTDRRKVGTGVNLHRGNILEKSKQDGYCYANGNNMHTGYAWAARRSALSDLGGLGDIGILGAGDRHMSYALIGAVDQSMPSQVQPSYREYWREWQNRAERHIRRNVGIMPGTISHYWHGSKVHRRYQDRWQILVQDKFDWTKDLKKDPQGVWQLTGRNRKLRDDLIAYMSVRNEDSVDL